MDYYDWKKIFKSKTEKELYRIFCGKSTLDSEAEIFAGAELINRGFDNNIVKEIAEKKSTQYRMNFIEATNPEKVANFKSSQRFRTYLIFGFILILAIIWTGRVFTHGETSLYLPVVLLFLLFIEFVYQKIDFYFFKKENDKKICKLKYEMEALNKEICSKIK